MKPIVGLLGVIMAAVAVEFNDQVPTVAIADVSGGLHIGHDASTWFDTAFVAAEMLGMSLAPWLAITFTLRHFAMLAVLLNAVSSALIPFASVPAALYMLRAAEGLSGGFTIPLLMITALRVLDPPVRLYGLAIYAMTATFIPALAATMAALWTDLVGWQFVFLEAVPICVVAGCAIWMGMEQDPPHYERLRMFDWRGALLVAVGGGSLSIMLQQGDRLDWFNSPLICVLGLVSAVTLPLFVLNEWFHELPLMKIQLLGRRNIAFGGVTLFTFILISQSGSSVPEDFLRQVLGLRPEQIFPVTLIIALPQIVLLPAAAWLLDFAWVDARVVNFVGLGMILAACIGGSLITGGWYPGQFVLWQALQAVGQPLVVMSLLLLATNAVHGPQEAPFASALVNTPRAVAEAVGVWLIQLIQRWRGGLHYDRLVDQAGQDRWRVLHGMPRPALAVFHDALMEQARVLTYGDTLLVFGAITAGLMIVALVLPQRTLPPRLQLAKH
jgi:DHA2 family multidrug resistance protein